MEENKDMRTAERCMVIFGYKQLSGMVSVALVGCCISGMGVVVMMGKSIGVAIAIEEMGGKMCGLADFNEAD